MSGSEEERGAALYSRLCNLIYRIEARIVRNSRVYRADVAEIEGTRGAKLGASAELVEAANQTIVQLQAELGQASKQVLSERMRLEERIAGLETEPVRLLGEHIMEDSQSGVLMLDEHNTVIGANNNASKYLGLEIPEIIGVQASMLTPDDSNFTRYMALFERNIREFAAHDMELKPHIFKRGEIPVTLTVYPTITGESVNTAYRGGFVILTPHVESSKILRKLTAPLKYIISVRGAVTKENVLQHIVPLMNSGKRAVYVDLRKTEKITTEALDAFVRCYDALAQQGAHCVFRNVSLDVTHYIEGRGVSSKHIRRIGRHRKCIASPIEITAFNKREESNKGGRRYETFNAGLGGLVAEPGV